MIRSNRFLINMYNATSTDDGTGEIETYESWLERQLMSRIETISLIEIERDSAIRSQKESFEEMDKQIQKLKEAEAFLISEIKLLEDSKAKTSYEIVRQNSEIEELKKENERLKGKIKEGEEENLILLKQNVAFSKLKGEFCGTLMGILCWDIPEELKYKIQEKISELKQSELE